MQRLAAALLVLVVAASVAPTAVGEPIRDPAAGQASGQTYAGTHVSFDAGDRAVTDYAVRGETMLESVRVESRSGVEEAGLVDVNASPSAVTRVEGAGLNVSAATGTEALLAAENGATVAAHDNRRGVLVVASGDQSDYAVAALPAGADAAAESDSEVEVTTENGTEGTFFVAGEGTVTVNDEGDVTAQLGEGGRLAFRSYPDGKDAADDEQERLLVQGEASAEAYVTTERASTNGTEYATKSGNATGIENASDGENANERGEVVVDAVTYDDDTTVEAAETAEGEVALAVNRTTHDGTVLLASVSGELLDASEEVTVTVDGETAAEAATYSQLESAVGSEQSRYAVETAESATASAEVAVGVNHFSERTVSIASPGAPDEEATKEEATDGGTAVDGTTADEEAAVDTGTTDGETTDDPASDEGATESEADESPGENSDGIPGFTPGVAVIALLAAVLLARRR